MANDWSEYQKEAATFFRGLGLDAKTEMTVIGETCEVVVALEIGR